MSRRSLRDWLSDKLYEMMGSCHVGIRERAAFLQEALERSDPRNRKSETTETEQREETEE